MALPIYRYPLDKTGENPDNYVGAEPHSLTPMARPTDVRVLAPIYGPFFAESLTITDQANGRELVKTTDYKITDLLQDPTLSFGKEIGQFAVITNGTVSNQVTVSYQVLGGNYQNDATAVQNVFETFLNDTRPVDWNDISGKPSTFPPSLHIHLLDDVIGWGPVIVALDSIRDAILLNNTPMYEALIDWVQVRKTPWENLYGVPTTAEGMGLTDVVLKTRRINTLAPSGLQGGGNLGNDLSLSLTNTGVVNGTYGTATQVAQFAVDNQGRIGSVNQVLIRIDWTNVLNRPTSLAGYGITDAVHNSRQILTPVAGGIMGGGPLNADLTLSLRDTGAVAGTYGTFEKIPVITADAKGRITRIAEVTPVTSWTNLTNKPTTVAQSGLTDAVASSRRVNTGAGLTGGGSLVNDLNLALTETGVVAGSYGNNAELTVITVDAYGRITRASTTPLNLSWSNLSGKPNTLGGFGITDGVTTNTNQTVGGVKTFNNIVTGWGSTAANIDDGAQSQIVSLDYLRRYVANAMNNASGTTATLRFGNFTIQAGIVNKTSSWTNSPDGRHVATLNVPISNPMTLSDGYGTGGPGGGDGDDLTVQLNFRVASGNQVRAYISGGPAGDPFPNGTYPYCVAGWS